MSRISSSIFSIYIATLLYTSIPYVQKLTSAGTNTPALFWNHFAIFAIFFCLAFFVLGRHVTSFAGHGKLFISAIALVGLILTVLYRIIPVAPVYKLPVFLAPYFGTDIAFTAWLIAPLAILFF
jgi:hypothetical protein